MHKYINYNIIEVYINRVSITTQKFHSDGLLDTDVREVPSFSKKTKRQGNFFPPVEVAGSMYLEIFFELYVSQRFLQSLERN